MRPQPDLPRKPPRRRRGSRSGSRFAGRGRLILGVLLATLIVLLISLRGIASFYTDYLWFDSLGLESVFRTVLGAKFSLTMIGAGVFLALCWVNLAIADRVAPVFRPSSGQDDLIERYHELVGERAGLVRLGVSVLLALVVGTSLGASWNEWVLFTNRVDFGEKDATFNTDVGFYVFQLPFLTTAATWLFSSLILVLIVTLMAHLINGGIRFHTQLDRVTPQVKAHVSVLLGALALVQVGRYWLSRYQLTFSTRGTVDGALYTDVKVELRAVYLLMLIAVFATALFIANIWRRGWVLPSMAVGLWIFVVVLAGGIVPWFVQRFRVEPAESSMEAPYIAHNIDATRKAYGLESVDQQAFPFSGELDAETIRANVDTISDIRLWDPIVMQESYEQQQQIRPFYAIPDVDVDRYELDGKLTQVMIAARSLQTSDVPQASWEARHLAYTHGYGVVVAEASTKTEAGGPELLAEDIPVRTSGGLPDVEQPAIYIGEGKSGYVIVDTDRQEIDYQDNENNTQYASYEGRDGVRIGSGVSGFVRKAAFALRFGDVNPLISGNIRADSKVLIERDVKERVTAVAPFLAFDHDPYVVLLDGEVKYVVDAYTTTRNYPNAQRADTGGLDGSSGLRGRSFNYARNSVKAVVDAYDGTVDLYVVDGEDPLIRAYTKAFPDLFTSVEDAPDGLVEHFRYPEDLFTVQTQMWSRYHVEDVDTFYNSNDEWTIPQEPGVTRLDDDTAEPAVGPDGQPLTDDDRFVPQYLLLQLPGEDEQSFIIMRPFVPSGQGRTAQRLLTSFMVASSDPDDYGTLRSYQMPGDNLPEGPSLAADRMESDDEVRRLQNLVCARGTTCRLRNLVMIPVGDSLLYVRSLFSGGDETGVPRLERVIVSYQSPNGTRVEVDTSLRGALSNLFGDDLPAEIENTDVTDGSDEPSEGEEPQGDEPEDGEDPSEPAEPGTPDEQEDRLIADIVAAFDDADAAAREGDQVTYAEKVQEAEELARELDQLRAGGGSGSGEAEPGEDDAEAGADGDGGGSGSGDTEGAAATTTTTAGT